MDCYGCPKKNLERFVLMKVQYEPKRQPFCQECADRLIKIKLGMM